MINEKGNYVPNKPCPETLALIGRYFSYWENGKKRASGEVLGADGVYPEEDPPVEETLHLLCQEEGHEFEIMEKVKNFRFDPVTKNGYRLLKKPKSQRMYHWNLKQGYPTSEKDWDEFYANLREGKSIPERLKKRYPGLTSLVPPPSP
jgi:hypothetical protein